MRCPECGNANREGARFCDNCGARLEPAADPQPAVDRRDDRLDVPSELRAPPSGSPELVGDGRFEVIGFLGEGTRKRVFLARDRRREGALTAVAVFSTEGMAATAQARARRETEAMRALGDHPRVVPVIAAGQDENRPFIASEYMPGGDLIELLDASPQRRLELDRALRIAADVAAGLEHAHSRGIIHRDIKPANVWLDTAGSARLGDFGLATELTRSREAIERMVVGTAAYLPPEQAIGRRSDARADLYSLGALLYEMLTGEPPFPGDDPVSIISGHLSAEPVPPSRHEERIPSELDALVGGLLAKSPEERPPDASRVRTELERLAASPPEPARREAGAENPLDALAGGVFVGRDPELEALRELLEAAVAGRGSVGLIEGEPGIGKTRLIEELTTYARVRGATVLAAGCHEAEATPAFWPFAQAIRSYVRDADPVGLAWQLGADGPELARLVPELRERVPSIGEPAPIEDEAARYRFFEAVSSFLIGASASRPLLLLVDDLHWADPSSLELLRFLAHRLGEGALLVLCAYRPDEAAARVDLRRALSELDEVPGRRHLSLGGLDREAIGRFYELTTGSTARPELVAEIAEQTGGNPFFIGEAVRLIALEGEGAAHGQGTVPRRVSEAIARRVDRLETGTRQALEAAAVLGREFDRDLLSRVLDGLPDAALEEAAAARIVERRDGSPGRFSFAHAVFREVLAEGIDERRRIELHRRAAEAIEELHSGALGPHLTALARHHTVVAEALGDAPSREKAHRHQLEAGRQAAVRLAHADAVEHLSRALALAAGRDRATLSLRLELGEEMTRAGRFGEAREVLLDAAVLARELDDSAALAEASIKIGALSQVGVRDEEIVGLLEEALRRAPAEDSSLRARLLARLALEEYWREPERATRLSDEAVELARRCGDATALAPALAARQFADNGAPGRVPSRLENAEQLLVAAREAGDRSNEVRAHAYRVTGLLQLGDVEGADRAIADYEALARRLGEPRHLWHVPVMRATRAVMAGRLEEAKALSAEGRRLGELAEEPLSIQFHTIQMAVILNLEGSAEEMLPVLRRMVEQYPTIPAWRLSLISFLVEAERLEEARREFEPIAARGFDRIPRDANFVVGISRVAEVAARLADERSCRDLLERLGPFSGEVVVIGRGAACQGPVDLYLGQMSGALGEHERAIDYLESSAALSERMGDRPILAETRLQLARAMLARGAPADRNRALELLSLVLEEGQKLGMRRRVERAVRLRLEAQGAVGVAADASIEGVALAVAEERPDLLSVASEDGRVAILFSDIENSTLMTERLGDERWLEVLRRHNAIFRRRLAEHSGYEVKSQGDGFMLAFGDPEAALRCALAVQADLEGEGGPAAQRIRVRMGMHVGEAIEEEGDFFGRSVILAARIAAQARGGEILVSDEVRRRGPSDCRFSDERELELKGLAGVHRVHRVDRSEVGTTA